MKRKSLSKALALMLASAMTLGLAACGNNSNSGASSNAGNTQSGSQAASNSGSSEASNPPAERQTISFSVVDVNAGANNTGDYAEEIVSQIEEYTGVDLDLRWVMNDTLTETNNSVMTNPDTMPQIMSWSGIVTGDVVAAAKNGAFVDLNDYIWDSDKYPNLSSMAQSVADTLVVDGKMIGIPRTRVVGRYGLGYRTDWAEKLELAEPATPEAVYDMLYAFTYDDPDGNGSDDTIGMEMTNYTGPFDIIQTWFGCGNSWAEVNGELVPVWMQDEYMDAVDYIKGLYDDGLMPADWATRPTETWSDGCKKGDNGVFIDVLDSSKRIWQYFEAEETYTPSVVNPDEPAHFTLYGAVNGHTMATPGYNGFYTLSARTLDTPEKIDAALTLLDKLCDTEMLILTQYGLEGVNYNMENGLIVRLDDDGSDAAKALANNYAGLNQLLTFLPSTEDCTARIPIEVNKYNKAQNDAYAAALPYAEVNPASAYLINSQAYADEGATLDEDVKAARTQYICGAITKEDFEAELQSIRTRGYDAIISEVNEQYKAN